MTNDHSRRGFLAVAGAGTAAAAGAALLGGADAAGAAQKRAAASTVPEAARTPLVAYVRDARTGEVCVLVDDREVVVHDMELAARIARVVHGGK